MASNHIMHFADPHHSLVKTEYSRAETGLCNICLLKLAGHEGYGCYTCNIHVHRACAGYFGEIISFFAHQPHSLRLSRSPGRICDICRGDCPRESLVYSCIGCGFDVHPLCAVLPERVANPYRPGHELCMVSSESPGSCSACSHPLLRWRYICSSRELHVACAIDPSTCAGQGSKGPAAIPGSYDTGVQGSHGLATQRSFGGQGWYHGPVTPGYNGHPIQAQGYGFAGQGSYYGVPVIQGGYGPPPIQGSSSSYPHAMPCGYGSTSSSGQSVFNSPTSLMTAIAKFLAGIAINAALSELASQILSGGFNN